MTVEAEIETITPMEAGKILEKNVNNRKLRQTRIETYARDMRNGKWVLNGESISFNGTGKLIDGQHRLLACILANKPFQTLVIRGLKDDSHATIDTGLTRTLADELRWQGEQHSAGLAAVLSLVWHYDQNVTEVVVPSRADLLVLLKKNPGIRDSLRAINVGKTTGVRGTALSATAFLMAREHDIDTADRFLIDLNRGTDYDTDHPCLALRRYALKVASNNRFRPTTREWFAAIIKVANAWLLGRPVRNVFWRSTGDRKESFPTIVSREDVEL